MSLREAGVTKPILLLEGVFEADDLQLVGEHGLSMVVHDDTQIALLEAVRLPARVPVYLKLNSGMNRLGFRFDNLRRTLPELLRSPNLDLEAIFTHFATADDPASSLFDEQRRRFDQVLADLKVLGARPRFVHAANSAAVVRDPRVWFDRVRPGLLLYGIVPPPLQSTIALAPVMTLTSKVTAVKGMRTGEVTGYGARFTAKKPTTIAIVPAGDQPKPTISPITMLAMNPSLVPLDRSWPSISPPADFGTFEHLPRTLTQEPRNFTS